MNDNDEAADEGQVEVGGGSERSIQSPPPTKRPRTSTRRLRSDKMRWVLGQINNLIRCFVGLRPDECWHSWEWTGRNNPHRLASQKCRKCGKVEVSVYSGGVSCDGEYEWVDESEVKNRW